MTVDLIDEVIIFIFAIICTSSVEKWKQLHFQCWILRSENRGLCPVSVLPHTGPFCSAWTAGEEDKEQKKQGNLKKEEMIIPYEMISLILT